MNRRLFLSGMLVAATASAESLGRLFFTPEQRTALERQRQTGKAEALLDDDQAVRFDGIVRSSSGRSTVWRNGRMTEDAADPRTKVGEILEPASGIRTDVVAPGAVRITRPRVSP